MNVRGLAWVSPYPAAWVKGYPLPRKMSKRLDNEKPIANLKESQKISNTLKIKRLNDNGKGEECGLFRKKHLAFVLLYGLGKR